MNTFQVHSLGADQLVVFNSKDLAEVYKLISKDEDFIVCWEENGKSMSQVIISNAISAKVKTGVFLLRGKQ